MTITQNLLGVCGALAALGLPAPAPASQNLVQNGDFELTDNPFIGGPNGDKKYFTTASPSFWNGGTGLTFLGAPRTAPNSAYLQVWAPFPDSSGPGDSGGNFVMADGDPNYAGAFWQTINITDRGLYEVTFDQAAGQEVNFHGPTTERWQVTFGSFGTQLSTLMSIPSHGFNPWQSEVLTFNVTDPGSYVLEFLAVGTPRGLPPISFLDNVGVYAVPAPGTVAMIGGGLLMAASRRRRP